jgi:tetratricopeptide (TPR) repeat protein
MKVFRAWCILNLIVLFSPIWAYAQSLAEESYDKGVEHAIQGKFKEAKKEFEKALMIDVYNKTAEASLKTINNVIAQKLEKEAAIHLFKGVSFADKGQRDQAIKEFTKAIEISPNFVEAYLNRGVSYDIKGQYDQAIEEFAKAIEINPRYAEAYNKRGFTYRKKDQYEQAIKDYTKSIEINPIDAATYINRGFVYDNKGQHDQAIKDYIKAVEINPICEAMVKTILLSRPDNRR